ncbi:MAG TPA: MlaE family lipid ABC transporter permease subunit [Myxococcota bacterium]|nr:MlaE family lipid ABC transporter permease subunit [Myxococcota bacterium]
MSPAAPVRAIGAAVLRAVRGLGRFALFVAAVLDAGSRPPLRLRRLIGEVYDAGVLSLLIVCVSGFAVGMVLGLQGYNTLSRFGAEESLGAVVGLSLIRELGPVLTSLLVAGRAGSAMAAEIAAMTVTEQLDGLRMMSVEPLDFVVAPKAFGMIVAMPLLSTLFVVFGILGGWMVGVALLGGDSGSYLTTLEQSVVFYEDVVGGIIKGVVFGVLVGFIATFRGFTAQPTTAGVSAAATSTVVIASVATLIFDYFITALWGY